jgi:DNA invertase Pin-like site-specific DNA recombinase
VRGRDGPGFISETDQFARCRAYAEAYGHAIIGQGSDLDVSGGVMSRPTFDRFLEQVNSRQADGIIVAKLDRFARTNVGALQAIEALEAAGGTLISVSEQIDSSTPAGRFLRTILFAAAQWERERIGEQWFAARSSAVARGIHVTRRTPPGYVRGPRTDDPLTDRRLRPDPETAPVIREAFAMAARGESNTAIAQHLTDALRNGHWQSYRVPRLLANRVYTGEARSGKGIVNAHAHEPLVDEQTFLLAQRKRPDGLRRPSATVSVLSGLVRCAGCSLAMKPQSEREQTKALYRCVKVSAGGRCPEPSVVAKERIEQYVVDEFLARYDELRLRLQDEHVDDQLLLADAQAAERSYRTALDNIELRKTIGDADHDTLLGSLHREWQAKQAAVRPAAPPVHVPEDMSLRELVAELDPPELRELLATGIRAVFVRKAASRSHSLLIADRVRIIWRDEPAPELPRRGERFALRRFAW